MTDRCEPPEALRNVSGWHWLKTPTHGPVLCRWCEHWGKPGDWRWHYSGAMENYISSDAIEVCEWQYVAPVPSPEIISDLVTALDRIAHMHHAEAMIAITALHKYDPSRRVLNNSPLPAIDTTIKPPAQYYPERQG